MTQVPLEWDLSPDAVADFREILSWSEREFGKAAALRYEELLIQAFLDLAAAPQRPGSKRLAELPSAEIYSYHLLFSRKRVRGATVHRPRHIILYRIGRSAVDIGRILHESRDLGRHLPDEFRSEE